MEVNRVLVEDRLETPPSAPTFSAPEPAPATEETAPTEDIVVQPTFSRRRRGGAAASAAA
jgi:hypothetical protein